MDRRKVAGCLMLAGAVLAFGVAELFAPSYAHVEQSSFWAGRIPEAVDQTADSRDLLKSGGRTVLLGALESERKLPIRLPDGGNVTVEVSDPDHIKAELLTEEKEDGSTESCLWMQRVQKDTTEDTTEDKKDTAGEETGTGQADSAGTSQDTETSENTETSEDTNTSGNTNTSENTETSGNTGTSGNTETPEQPETPENPDETEEAADLSVTVTWTGEGEEGQTKSAVFQMKQRAEEGTGSFSLAEQTTSYHQRTPLSITAGEEDVVLLCNGSGFPSMTRYREGEAEYLLYDKMPLALAAGTEITLDLSETGLTGDLTLSAGQESKKTLKYQELSTLDTPEKPVLVGKKAVDVPVVWTREEQAATFTVERLENTEQGLSWNVVEDDSVGVVPDPDGKKLTLTSRDAAAGTYRVTFIWQQEGTETAREVIPFYVFYAEGEEDE